jgi:Domain of unknown function (DUF4417)
VIPVRAADVPVPAARCQCEVCPFYVDNRAAVEPICSGTNTDCSYCGCARSTCGECPIRCGSRVDIAAWMADVGGTLLFDDLAPVSVTWPGGLARFIPMLDGTGTGTELDTMARWPAYALGLRRMFSAATGSVMPVFRDRTAVEVLGVPTGTKTVLVGYGTDPLVEMLWTRRHTGGLADVIARQGWDLVLAPNYSMYGNQPRTEHLLNMRRNLLIASEWATAGVPAVANLYWYRVEDLERIAQWIADTTPVAVATNCQTFRTDHDWADFALPGLTYLADVVDTVDVRVVLTGLSRPDRIATVLDLFGDRVHLVSQNPIQYARHGAVMTARGRVEAHASVADAFAASTRFYAALFGRR